ncbi:DnaE-like error-prone DNA polymerase [Stackebrandtia endophytica]|uniref:Error-prone DNA polymerase n=1 Tax=Stackebrandtia endophytica TaxID=1496996 RepID=A0A543B2Q2_9ACTN|nr:error-prone DNA polymerase [Stackebrandtia endophytica]TQL79108.1 DnaE-like error-prone DNA polymerase [Stackebrandtia endophytica]
MTDYAELHCHSYFSFGDGADSPQRLVTEAARLGLSGLAITDHDGYYGVAQFAEAAQEVAIPTVFGAELSLDLPGPRTGTVDPGGNHLVVLARDPEGYQRLSRAITVAQLAGSKAKPKYSLDDLARSADGHWLVLTGCRRGAVPLALETGGMSAAGERLDQLIGLFGRSNVAVELIHHDQPGDDDRIDALVELARRYRVPTVATNNVHYASPSRQQLAQVQAATRSGRTLEEVDGWLPAAATAHLRSPDEMLTRFAAHPEAVAMAAELAAECAFDLKLVKPELPTFSVPDSHSEFSYLAELTLGGAANRYGPSDDEQAAAAYDQLDNELTVIRGLDFSGYFLIVADIVRFCRDAGILCQGRGSAANSAVCYALGITNVDAVRFNLLFERFLSSDRDGPPDIDLDIESGRREEAIQYVYERYGRSNAAQVANVISYRPRSAIRDVAKALGYSHQQALDWSKQLDRWGKVQGSDAEGLPGEVERLADDLLTVPRHLGLHPGGMVICATPVSEVVPIEWARATNRSVLQWDKDDCAFAGLVKFDLLGLGMLTALQEAIRLVADQHQVTVDLAKLPQEDEVYDMLCAADTVGVFQVESRAQMGTLPRLRPREFYDLVVEVALIRPGPIQGGSVHPYLSRRSAEKKEVGSSRWRDHVHPRLHKALEHTYGVPLFQEQLMQMAVDAAGFNPAEADQLRRAMGSKRSAERMERLKGRLYAGMAERGIAGQTADEVFEQLAGFADFGFPESHAASFAHIVYSSAWLKCHYPAAFTAALLNAQPMGFYSVNTLVADARRHGVEVRRPDVNISEVKASLEPDGRQPAGSVRATAAIRLGISQIRGINSATAERVVAGRPYSSLSDVVRRAGLSLAQLEALATADAFASLGIERRQALWLAGIAAQEQVDMLPGTTTTTVAPALPGMSAVELSGADYWSVRLSPDSHPVQFARGLLDAGGVLRIEDLATHAKGSRVWVAGLVTHRQRPSTAGGITFLNVEDETGMLNVICSEGLWRRYRRLARSAVALRVRGVLEGTEGVVNLMADKLIELELPIRPGTSRDFR